ncbi:MAG: hypothetical protein D6705_03210, partial [Deltaproteobacteria bacterium]
MKGYTPDGRIHMPELPWRVVQEGDRVELRAPKPGYLRDLPPPGARVGPKDACGVLEVLGRAHRLRIPEGAAGFLAPARPDGIVLARTPVAFDEPVLLLEAGAEAE